MDTTNRAMETIKAHSNRLNQLSDSTAQSVRKVEEFLQEIGVGDTNAAVSHNNIQLVWVRVGNKFRIAVKSESETKAWADCGRSTKLDTFVLIPNLLQKLAIAIEELVTNAEQTIIPIKISIDGAL